MTESEAKKIGSRQGLICSGLGVFIAQFIMTAMISYDQTFLRALFWFTRVNYKLNLFIGIILLLLCGYFYGQIAGRAILIKNRNFILVGFLCSMAVLLTTAFLSGWTGFFQEGIYNIGTKDNPFEDYIIKPFYCITMFGILPALFVGILFGAQIKRKGKRQNIQEP
jgi:multisubunit Na+/H+ antiporter MnhB subunit